MDLTEGGNTGSIKNCEIMKYNAKDYIVDFIPYRRDSKIRVEEHENNGYTEGMWKDQNTRWNQLRFENEVQEGSVDFTKDINYRKTACQIKNQIHAHSFIHYQLPRFNNHKIIRAEIRNNKSTGKVGEIVEENNKYIIINSIDYDIKLYVHE